VTVGAASTVDCIAEAFDLAATLQLRYLARGTSLTSRTLLALLDKNGPARLSELSATIGVSKPVITHSVGRMAREGLVIRTVDPADGRATLVEITDAGRALRKEQRNELHERTAEVLNTLSPRTCWCSAWRCRRHCL
jgi:DNA-binding MarR family transcriptional regulator